MRQLNKRVLRVPGRWGLVRGGRNGVRRSRSSSLRSTFPGHGRISLPSCNVMRCLELSIDPEVGARGFRRADSRGDRTGIQCGEHGNGILVDDGEQSTSRRFRGPPPSLPVLDRVKAEPESARESGLGHTQSISDRFHVNFLRHLYLESFSLPSEKGLNIFKAIHHLFEIGFSCELPYASKILSARFLSR